MRLTESIFRGISISLICTVTIDGDFVRDISSWIWEYHNLQPHGEISLLKWSTICLKSPAILYFLNLNINISVRSNKDSTVSPVPVFNKTNTGNTGENEEVAKSIHNTNNVRRASVVAGTLSQSFVQRQTTDLSFTVAATGRASVAPGSAMSRRKSQAESARDVLGETANWMALPLLPTSTAISMASKILRHASVEGSVEPWEDILVRHELINRAGNSTLFRSLSKNKVDSMVVRIAEGRKNHAHGGAFSLAGRDANGMETESDDEMRPVASLRRRADEKADALVERSRRDKNAVSMSANFFASHKNMRETKQRTVAQIEKLQLRVERRSSIFSRHQGSQSFMISKIDRECNHISHYDDHPLSSTSPENFTSWPMSPSSVVSPSDNRRSALRRVDSNLSPNIENGPEVLFDTFKINNSTVPNVFQKVNKGNGILFNFDPIENEKPNLNTLRSRRSVVFQDTPNITEKIVKINNQISSQSPFKLEDNETSVIDRSDTAVTGRMTVASHPELPLNLLEQSLSDLPKIAQRKLLAKNSSNDIYSPDSEFAFSPSSSVYDYNLRAGDGSNRDSLFVHNRMNKDIYSRGMSQRPDNVDWRRNAVVRTVLDESDDDGDSQSNENESGGQFVGLTGLKSMATSMIRKFSTVSLSVAVSDKHGSKPIGNDKTKKSEKKPPKLPLIQSIEASAQFKRSVCLPALAQCVRYGRRLFEFESEVAAAEFSIEDENKVKEKAIHDSVGDKEIFNVLRLVTQRANGNRKSGDMAHEQINSPNNARENYLTSPRSEPEATRAQPDFNGELPTIPVIELDSEIAHNQEHAHRKANNDLALNLSDLSDEEMYSMGPALYISNSPMRKVHQQDQDPNYESLTPPTKQQRLDTYGPTPSSSSSEVDSSTNLSDFFSSDFNVLSRNNKDINTITKLTKLMENPLLVGHEVVTGHLPLFAADPQNSHFMSVRSVLMRNLTRLIVPREAAKIGLLPLVRDLEDDISAETFAREAAEASVNAKMMENTAKHGCNTVLRLGGISALPANATVKDISDIRLEASTSRMQRREKKGAKPSDLFVLISPPEGGKQTISKITKRDKGIITMKSDGNATNNLDLSSFYTMSLRIMKAKIGEMLNLQTLGLLADIWLHVSGVGDSIFMNCLDFSRCLLKCTSSSFKRPPVGSTKLAGIIEGGKLSLQERILIGMVGICIQRLALEGEIPLEGMLKVCVSDSRHLFVKRLILEDNKVRAKRRKAREAWSFAREKHCSKLHSAIDRWKKEKQRSGVASPSFNALVDIGAVVKAAVDRSKESLESLFYGREEITPMRFFELWRTFKSLDVKKNGRISPISFTAFINPNHGVIQSSTNNAIDEVLLNTVKKFTNDGNDFLTFIDFLKLILPDKFAPPLKLMMTLPPPYKPVFTNSTLQQFIE